MKRHFHLFKGETTCTNTMSEGINLSETIKGKITFSKSCLYAKISEIATAIGVSFHYNANVLHNSITIGWIPVGDKIDLYLCIDLYGKNEFKFIKSVETETDINYSLQINKKGHVVATIDDLTATTEFTIPDEAINIDNPHVQYPVRKWSKLIFPRIHKPYDGIYPLRINIRNDE